MHHLIKLACGCRTSQTPTGIRTQTTSMKPMELFFLHTTYSIVRIKTYINLNSFHAMTRINLESLQIMGWYNLTDIDVFSMITFITLPELPEFDMKIHTIYVSLNVLCFCCHIMLTLALIEGLYRYRHEAVLCVQG